MPLLVSRSPARAQVPAEGTLGLDGDEQVLVEIQGHDPFRVVGYVDFSNLALGDRVILREYIVIKEDGEYGLYAGASYEDEQVSPLVYVESKVSRYGIKVTINQEAGLPRDIDFQFFRKKV